MRRVVVTGMGALTPIGNNVEEYWNALLEGKNGGGPITYFDTEKFKTKFACELKGYDPTAHFNRKEIKTYDKFTQYALVSAQQAVEDADVKFRRIKQR